MTNTKILIVEDEALIAYQLQLELEQVGYTVLDTVSSGKEAIASVKKENPDVIIMDIRLSREMDGIETAKEIGKFSSAKIIFVTGYHESGLKEKAIELNPTAYLNKPVGWYEIDEVIRSSRNNT